MINECTVNEINSYLLAFVAEERQIQMRTRTSSGMYYSVNDLLLRLLRLLLCSVVDSR